MTAPAILALVTLLVQGGSADSLPPRPIHQLVHTTWTPKVGGGPAGVRSFAQTSDGYIWIGTFFGLVRFDGVRFVKYTPLGGDTLPSEEISRLMPGRDGSLWMTGGNGGVVARLRAGRAVTYGKAAGLFGVYQVVESSKGMVVVGTSNGLFRFTDGKWESVGAAWGYPAKQARALFFDRDDGLWVMSEDRILYLPPGGNRFLDPGYLVKGAPIGSEFAQEKDGTIWFMELGQALYTLRNPGEKREPTTELKIDPQAILIDRKGSLWVASGSDGLRRVPAVARIRGRRVEKFGPEAERFAMKDGLLTDIPLALMEDREGNIWVGGPTGVERFREGAFAAIPGPGPGRPRFVTAGRDSSVWSGPWNHGSLQRYGPHSRDSLHPGFNLWTVAQDSSGRTLIVDGDKRLLRLEGRRFVPVPLRPGTARGLWSLTVDPSGTVWIYSAELGLLRLAGDSLVQVDPLEDLYHTGTPFSDSKGRIWVGQANRVAMYSGAKVTRYERKQGINGFVYGFFEDREGTVWAATGDGLSRFTGDRFRTLTSKHGIPGSTVHGMAQDDAGSWWLATLPGILRFPPGEIERVLADSAYVPRYRAFDESDGMVGALVKGYYGSVLVKAGDGKIWVTTDSGLARIDPARLPDALPPPVSIEAVRIQGREIAITDAAEIPSGTTDLEIDYTSLTFSTPERVRFRYRLEGADTAWRVVGPRREAYYTELAPGSYRFQVTASYEDGVWNEAGAVLSFRVLPAWYQTLWFRALVVLAIGGLGGGAVALLQRGRHRRAQRALKDRYEATLAERVRIAQDLHDTLLQGFAGVSMQLKAAERALPEQPDVAAETLILVQRLTRETLREARERVLDLHEPDLANEDLATALDNSARGLIATTGIGFSLTIRGNRRRLPRAVEIAAIRIGREAIANAVKHAEARRIEVVVGFEPSALQLEVRDDGRGFAPEQGEQARQQGHLGLTGMRNRAAGAGGTCEVRSGQGGGTVVALELPLSDGRGAG